MYNKNYHASERLKQRYELSDQKYTSVVKGLLSKIKSNRVKYIKPACGGCYEVKAKYGKVIYRFIVNETKTYIITFLPNDNHTKKMKIQKEKKFNQSFKLMNKKMEIRKKKKY